MWKDAHFAYLRYIIRVQVRTSRPDLLMLGNPVTDEFSHMFLGLTVPMVNGLANPYYNNYYSYGKAHHPGDGEGYLKEAYARPTRPWRLPKCNGKKPTVFATSDHGFGAQWLAVNAGKVLADANIQKNGDGTEVFSNCRGGLQPPPARVRRSTWPRPAGPAARRRSTSTRRCPTGTTYAQVRTAVVNAFSSLTDPANPGAQVVLKIMKKEELRNVDGSDSLHPNRSGDVVVVLKPPYQFDAATLGQTIAFSQFFGQHGYLPETVDLAASVNMHATFVAAGPGIRQAGAGSGRPRHRPGADHLVPAGRPRPDQRPRQDPLRRSSPSPGRYKEATILSISDFHGQLTPESETSDTVGPTFAISGAAYLKPWFDWYRAEAHGGSIFVTAGDSVGATPPISNFFGDKPTIEALNMMGLSADTLGNHNFDRGSEYLRTELIPLANYPYLAANVVYPDGRFPPEWKASDVFEFDGFKLGVVGYTLHRATLPDLPRLPRSVRHHRSGGGSQR